MICRTKPFVCAPTHASTAFSSVLLLLLIALVLDQRWAKAESAPPEIARMLERALADAENLRQQLKTAEYDASMRVHEWDGRGQLRGMATAQAIVRPGDPKPMTFISRKVEGRVRLPDDKPSKDDDDKEVTLQEFAREHRIAERFAYEATGWDEIAGARAQRITFRPKPNQPRRKTADRFLNRISGSGWISEGENKLVKFELKLEKPLQLFWIFAVLKDLSIRYELLEPGDILGHAKIKVAYALTTPIYSIQQLHDVEIDNFRRRQSLAAH
ncbi:MAG TPA: hypothetical protein VG095_00495 [Chthoniobacterales bacterium]|nr:hypothetical protein [Chthoniobacterales bacterium]